MADLKDAEKRYEQYAKELGLAVKNEAPEDLLIVLREDLREMGDAIEQFSNFFCEKFPEI